MVPRRSASNRRAEQRSALPDRRAPGHAPPLRRPEPSPNDRTVTPRRPMCHRHAGHSPTGTRVPWNESADHMLTCGGTPIWNAARSLYANRRFQRHDLVVRHMGRGEAGVFGFPAPRPSVAARWRSAVGLDQPRIRAAMSRLAKERRLPLICSIDDQRPIRAIPRARRLIAPFFRLHRVLVVVRIHGVVRHRRSVTSLGWSDCQSRYLPRRFPLRCLSPPLRHGPLVRPAGHEGAAGQNRGDEQAEQKSVAHSARTPGNAATNTEIKLSASCLVRNIIIESECVYPRFSYALDNTARDTSG